MAKELAEKIADQRKVISEANQKLDELVMQEVQERTDSYDSKLVEEARKLGVNPDNFESQEALEKGIKKFKADNAPDEPKQPVKVKIK